MEGILEGLLYVQGDEGLTIEDVENILNISEEEAKILINNLKKEYENENRGLRINYLGNTFKLTTKQEHKEYYQKLLENPRTNTLSTAALEVLAIIAYNEPITRVKVDEIRGVESSHIVRNLLSSASLNLTLIPSVFKENPCLISYPDNLDKMNDLPLFLLPKTPTIIDSLWSFFS